jgi:putative oxidoreductase
MLLKSGELMQRLFSTFPNSWPGCGLLLLRLEIAALSIFSMFALGSPAWLFLVLSVCALLATALLAVGLWTPIAGVTQAVISLSLCATSGGFYSIYVTTALSGLVIAMTGPGAWSVDARLFGRKRMDFDFGNSDKNNGN